MNALGIVRGRLQRKPVVCLYDIEGTILQEETDFSVLVYPLNVLLYEDAPTGIKEKFIRMNSPAGVVIASPGE